METVKDLVVGEDADAQVIVGKALMEGLLYGVEGYSCRFSKNIPQTFILFLAVGENIDLITFQQIVLKRLFQQVEVLMEERLDGDVKVESGE